jgi:Gpi18-like mannosyltransferase
MVLRLLKITRIIGYSAGIRIGLRAIRRSSDAVYMLLMYLLVVQLFLSTAIFWAERGEWNTAKGYWARSDGSRSPFNSIPEGFYWAITTLATVGYGDVVPITRKSFFYCIVNGFIIKTNI